jgi:hypothetical protein
VRPILQSPGDLGLAGTFAAALGQGRRSDPDRNTISWLASELLCDSRIRLLTSDSGTLARWPRVEMIKVPSSVPQRARRRHAYIVFVDEAGFMLAPVRRRTWAPRGQTPVIKLSEPHGRISVIGAITISPKRTHFGFHFHLLADDANFHGDSVARFIEDVHQRVRNPVTLVWDAIPIHSARPVRDYLWWASDNGC